MPYVLMVRGRDSKALMRQEAAKPPKCDGGLERHKWIATLRAQYRVTFNPQPQNLGDNK